MSLELHKYFNKKIFSIFLLGFASGFPIVLIAGTLSAWFKTSNASVVVIGYLSLLTQPYSYKFLWAPVFDYFKISKKVDQRKGWLYLIQALSALGLFVMSQSDPTTSPWILVIAAGLVAFFSASQDIIIDGYRAAILEEEERGLGTAVAVEGYRIATILSGAGALIIADKLGWKVTYQYMAAIMALTMLFTYISPDVKSSVSKNKRVSFLSSIKENFSDLLKREKIFVYLALAILYKVGDAFSHALTTPFLIDIGFSLTEVGAYLKTTLLVAGIIGIFLGGIILTKLDLFKALLFFGVLQSVTNLLYMLLAEVGYNTPIAISALFVENLCSGMGTAAYLSLLLSLCNKKFSGTQYALLTSLSSLGRVYIGPVAGHIVEGYGWSNFYLFSAIAAIPGVILVIYLKDSIQKNSRLAKEDKKKIPKGAAAA